MDWLLLAAFCIMWMAFLIPTGRRRSATTSVADFERRMEHLAYAEIHGSTGRWIVTPRKGARFVGTAERTRARARERRRRVLAFLLEAIALSFLIGLAPPLRVVWYATVGLAMLLTLYVWMLLTIKHREQAAKLSETPGAAAAAPKRPATHRHVADGPMAWARPVLNGLGTLGEGDHVHVVVKPAQAAAGG